MLSWARDLATTCDIPAFIGFNASSIAQFSFLYHIPFLLSSGQLNPDGTLTDVNQLQRLSGIPGVVDIPFSSVPWLGIDEDRSESTFCGLASMYDSVLDQLDCILFNSFTEMEKEAVEALVEETGRVKMAPVGPMLLLYSSCTTTAKGESPGIIHAGSKHVLPTVNHGEIRSAGGCLEWLEGRAKHSVLYIAFGTTAWLRREDLNALARGIEASEVLFLWVVRQDLVRGHGSDNQSASCTAASAIDNILPVDFLERTKGRASFTSWAPQTRVLSHPAIGAFLTHGGWNSMLEAISNGVPMLLWPDFWDQKFHTQQAVEQWKVGLRVRIHSYCAAACKEKIDKELTVHDHELRHADAPLQLYDAAG
ncbi:hypothetical protein GOP47_0003920 [Adiantum capillus-veneris]|uniref:UDP-glycosyltransferases domain-containing protein n=1 Tax=Adiantum capillus-veneris TaxID=13818 RepID=A0A9D4ZP11_ADICA|nr:hypothetical protein GOP47_0003920 [Adiantum capillus-veneris]